MNKVKGSLLIVIGVLLVIAGIVTYTGKILEDKREVKETEKAIEDGWDDVKTSDELRELNPEYDENVEVAVVDGKELPRTSIHDGMLGVITAESVGLREPIFQGASELNMRRGVATVKIDNYLDDNTIALAGHRSGNPTQYFTGVLRLKEGHEVVIETKGEGGQVEKTVYVVGGSSKVLPTDMDILDEDSGDGRRKLIMITCDEWNPSTGLYDKRWVTVAHEKGS